VPIPRAIASEITYQAIAARRMFRPTGAKWRTRKRVTTGWTRMNTAAMRAIDGAMDGNTAPIVAMANQAATDPATSMRSRLTGRGSCR